ncbi:hypothetical protein Hanom_Chr16g01497351 [Helianthus anomalus]
MKHGDAILRRVPVPGTARGRKRLGEVSQKYPDIGDFYICSGTARVLPKQSIGDVS